MFKRYWMVLSLLAMCLVLTGCEEELSLGGAQPLVMDHSEQKAIGSAEPKRVDPVDANNKEFKNKLKPFNTEQDLYQMSEEEVWDWVLEAEKTFQQGVLQQFTYTEEQMAELKSWMSGYFTDELRDKRLEKGIEKVEGGYALEGPSGLYDFYYKFVERVIDLELDKRNENHVILHAEFVVRQNQAVEATYEYQKKDGKWKLTDYDFKLVE